MSRITDRALTAKTDKDSWLYDDAVSKGHGELCARITGKGSRRFYFRYTGADGERVRLPLGAYDPTGVAGLTLKAARLKAGELSLLHQAGVTDIKGHLEAGRRLAEAQRAEEEARLEAERKAAEIEASRLTVNQLFERWYELRISKHKDGGKEIRRMFDRDVLPAIGALPAHLVRKRHVMEITDAIEDRGALRVAKMIFSNLRQMFRFALARDYVEMDPTAAINKAEVGGPTGERDRALSAEEIKLLAEQLPSSGLSPTSTAAVWTALATGCRIGELLKARWEHVDLENRRWLIPAENSKNGLPLEVYLSEFALAQFRVIEQHRRPDGVWLFPARNKKKGDTHVCTKTITKQLVDRQRTEAMANRSANTGTLALPGGKWTAHDLRRTCSTIMGELGVKPEIIDRCQNHKEPNRIRRIYQRYSYQPEMRQAWELLGERLESLVSGEETAKVIPLDERRA